MNKLKNLLPYWPSALSWVLSLAAAAVGWLQVERSAGQENYVLLALAPQYLLLGVLTIFSVHLLVYALCGRRHIATAAGGLIVTVYALVNYYVKMLHGTAILAFDIANAATAADVAGSYDIAPDPTSIKIALCYLPVLAAAVVQWLLYRKSRASGPAPRGKKRPLIRISCCALFLFFVYFFGYFGPWSVMPRDTATLAKAVAFYYQDYGYTSSLVSSFLLLENPVAEPEGYDPAVLTDLSQQTKDYRRAVPESDPGSYPDIIVILNESFYDLSLVTDPDTDVPYLDFYRSLQDSAVTGYTLVPDVGGGTNRSEFSLLTSAPMTLLPGITPFSNMDMNGQFSIVTYLQSLGYNTMAAHPAMPQNYRRGTAWPALGFETTYFEPDFSSRDRYGDRIYLTDSAAYDCFVEMYEAMPEDSPRFAYLLTMQNHGGYEENSEEDLLVHAGTDYQELGHVTDEYLSCISLSDQALAELVDYFTLLYQETGRRVVLVMTGDHAPYMVDSLTDASLSGTEREIRQRATPFVLWTNYPTEYSVEIGNADGTLPVIDLCALLPLTVEQAGLPLSPYYQYILAMRETCAAWDNLSGALTPDGSYSADGENDRIDTWLSGYHALSYNLLGPEDEFVAELFLPAGG